MITSFHRYSIQPNPYILRYYKFESIRKLQVTWIYREEEYMVCLIMENCLG
nr:MAG TPA: hypothetical protein [Caudoviricetes sp.]